MGTCDDTTLRTITELNLNIELLNGRSPTARSLEARCRAVIFRRWSKLDCNWNDASCSPLQDYKSRLALLVSRLYIHIWQSDITLWYKSTPYSLQICCAADISGPHNDTDAQIRGMGNQFSPSPACRPSPPHLQRSPTLSWQHRLPGYSSAMTAAW